MGTPKAALEWHGSTLLRRTVGILARATGGPVVVVRAHGQDLPGLPAGTVVVDDPREGKGPVQGIAAGLAALRGQAETAFVTSTDLPFLHPAFISRVLTALDAPGQGPGKGAAEGEGAGERPDVALPVARGYQQPLAAAYRTGLAELAERLVNEDKLRPAFLFAECAVTRLDDAALLADPVLAARDPDLDSVLNVNTPGDYAAARQRPAPEVTVRLSGALIKAGVEAGRTAGPRAVRAATIGAAAEAVGLPFGRHVTAVLNADEINADEINADEITAHQITRDPSVPLAAGDTVLFMPASS